MEAILRRKKHEATLSFVRRAQSQQYKGNHLLSHRRFLGRGYHGSMANLHRSSKQHVLHVSQASRGASSLKVTLRRHLSAAMNPLTHLYQKSTQSLFSAQILALGPLVQLRFYDRSPHSPKSKDRHHHRTLTISRLSFQWVSHSQVDLHWETILLSFKSHHLQRLSHRRDFTSSAVLSSRTSSIAKGGSISAKYPRHHVGHQKSRHGT